MFQLKEAGQVKRPKFHQIHPVANGAQLGITWELNEPNKMFNFFHIISNPHNLIKFIPFIRLFIQQLALSAKGVIP